MEPDALVREYLGRLEAAARSLNDDRRGELLAEVREHIEAALTDAGRSDEATVRNVLDRLGPPEEIVSAEAGTDAAAAAPPAVLVAPSRAQGLGVMEIAALLLLTVGAFALPIIGPLLGLVFVWLSQLWSTRVKLVLTVIVVVLFVLPVLFLYTVD